MFVRSVLAVLLTSIAVHAQTLSGQILEDHSGTPLPSVNVRIAHPGDKFLAAELETDRDGRFQAALPAGEYRLEFVRSGYASTKAPITLTPGGANATLRMVKLGVISGRISNQQNQPISNATFYALPKPPGNEPVRPPSGAGRSATSNAKGEYRIQNLPPGEYYVVTSLGASTRAMGSAGSPATSASYGSQFVYYPNSTRPEALAFAGGEDRRNVDFTVLAGPLFQVSGKVDPKPENTYFVVGLFNPDRPALAIAVAEAKADGTFHLTGIQPGVYKLVAASSARARNSSGFLLDAQPIFGSTTVNVSAMDITGIVVAADAARTVTFDLKTSASCPAATKVDLVPLEEWGSRLNRTIDLVAGQPATISNLAPARYALTSPSATSDCYLSSEFVLDLSASSPSAAVNIVFAPAAEVRGKLDSGVRGPSAFSIALISTDAQAFELATPNAEGRFSFAGLRPGRYRMAAFPSGQRLPDASKMFEFEVRAGSNAEIDLVAPAPEVKQ